MVLYGYQSKRNPHRIQGKLWQRFITTIAGVTSLMLLLGLFTSNDMSRVHVFKLAAEPQVVNIRYKNTVTDQSGEHGCGGSVDCVLQ